MWWRSRRGKAKARRDGGGVAGVAFKVTMGVGCSERAVFVGVVLVELFMVVVWWFAMVS